MNWLELFLGQIPEALYFALFIIFSKQLKTKRSIFIILIIIEEFLITRVFQYTIWFQVLFTVLMYTILKILYKEKAQITDIFTFMISSLILSVINGLSYFIFYGLKHQFLISVIISRILLILFLMIFKNKLYKIQNLYKKFWNRNDKIKKKMKSTTFRCINLFVFNIMFYIANFIFIYTIYRNGGV